MLSILLATLSILNVNAAEKKEEPLWDYDYAKNGEDWPELKPTTGNSNNYCGGSNQSPINLMQPIGSYGWAYGETVPKIHDNISKTFKDLRKGNNNVKYNKYSIGMNLHEHETEDNHFTSDLATKYFNTAGNQFQNTRFELKTASEHTVNGKHFDLELQIFFENAKVNETSTVNQAAIAILFDVTDFNKDVSPEQTTTVATFFDEITKGFLKAEQKVDETLWVVEQINWAQLLDMVDMKDRWIYEGSMTTPPCSPGVYWNVIRTIYPINNDKFEQIKEKIHFLASVFGKVAGNKYDKSAYAKLDAEENRARTKGHKFYRKLQKITDQSIKYVGAVYIGKVVALTTGLVSSFIIWACA